MTNGAIVIRKVWRSEAKGLVVFVALCIAAIVLSKKIPATVVSGELFQVMGKKIWLSLPVLWLAPFTWFSMLAFRVYNVRFVADSRGLEAYDGILSFSQKIIRIRYEDVRSIESDQTLIERLLDVGTVEVGTAASAGIELQMEGIAAPKAVQDFIQNERDRRQRMDSSARAKEKEKEKVSV